MATVDKNFRIKNGLVVEGSTATVNGSNILTENSTEFIQDTAAAIITGGTHTNITATFDDSTGTLNLVGAVTYTDEQAQDAVGNAVGTGLSYNDTTGAISVDTTAIQAKVANVSDTEIGYLDGVTSAIQTQLNAKASSSDLTTHTGATEAHGATGAVVGTTNTQTLTNKTLTAPILTGPVVTTLTLADSSISFEGSSNDTNETLLTVINPTEDRTITLPDSTGTVALTNNKLDAFAATTSAELRTVISDETGTGGLVFANTPTLVTPNIGAATGISLVLSGDLTVNGTTTTINSTEITVDDKNLTLGSVASPTDAGADGGGITLKGATDKTLNWVDATDAWTSSENFNLASGKTYLANGTAIKDVAETLTNKTLTSPVINTPTGITKSDVGLANVDNTTDANKPVSTATQTALDFKAPLASPALTGTPTAPTAAPGTDTTQVATTAFVKAAADAAVAVANALTTDDVAEGTAQYFTDARARTAVDGTARSFTSVELNSVAKQVAATTGNIVTAAATTAYSWAKSSYRSAEFLVKSKTSTHTEITKIMLTLDSSDNVYLTEYGMSSTSGTSLQAITADISGTDVRIRVTPANANTEVLITGTLLV
jgi:hypothetical protein